MPKLSMPMMLSTYMTMEKAATAVVPPYLSRNRFMTTLMMEVAMLLDHPDIFDDLDRQIREKMVQNPVEAVQAEPAPLEDDEDDEIDLDDDEEFALDA